MSLLRLLNMARCKLPGPERQRARRMRWHSPHTWPVEKVEPRQWKNRRNIGWKMCQNMNLTKSANCSSELALSATSILPPGIMIIQWEFRFPVLRVSRELCKQSKEMGTGSEDANRMPIEFSLQLAFCWQMVIRSWKSAAKCVIRPPLNLFAAKALMRFATTKDHPSVWLPFGHANEHVRILRLQATDSKIFKAALELLILTIEREMPLQ